MQRTAFWRGTPLVALVFAGAAEAGMYTDDLSKCLVASTTKEDRASLMRWMFSAASANPAVASIGSVTPEQMDKANAATGALYTKLLTQSCKEQTKKALRYEGDATVQISFQVLGQVAAAELFSSPEVAKAMSGLDSHIDKKKIEELKAQDVTP